MTQMAEFWVAVAFGVFVLILLYYKVPKLIAKSLDDRAEAIRKELDEARRLREEAQTLLADYQKQAPQRRPGGRRHRRSGASRGRGLRARDARQPEGRAGAAHQAGRGQDRARRGPGGRRGARCGDRRGDGGGREDPAREDGRLGGAVAHRPEHPRPQGPAELRRARSASGCVERGEVLRSETILRLCWVVAPLDPTYRPVSARSC